MVKGLIQMINGPDSFIDPVTFGNHYEFSMLQLAEVIVRLTDSRLKIIFKPLPQDDPHQRCPDIGLAREKVDWEPKIDLEEGLKRTIKYFKSIFWMRATISFFDILQTVSNLFFALLYQMKPLVMPSDCGVILLAQEGPQDKGYTCASYWRKDEFRSI